MARMVIHFSNAEDHLSGLARTSLLFEQSHPEAREENGKLLAEICRTYERSRPRTALAITPQVAPRAIGMTTQASLDSDSAMRYSA